MRSLANQLPLCMTSGCHYKPDFCSCRSLRKGLSFQQAPAGMGASNRHGPEGPLSTRQQALLPPDHRAQEYSHPLVLVTDPGGAGMEGAGVLVPARLKAEQRHPEKSQGDALDQQLIRQKKNGEFSLHLFMKSETLNLPSPSQTLKAAENMHKLETS